jgi:hypothetical protein
VLSKTKRADKCQELILQRQHAMNADEDEADAVAEFIAGCIRSQQHDPETERIRIKGPILCNWLAEATGERITRTIYKRKLKELNLPQLREYKNDQVSGWLWTGAKAGPSSQIKDLKIADYERPMDPEIQELLELF